MTSRPGTRVRATVLVVLGAIVVGCSGSGTPGGAEDLPGPVPEGVSFEAATEGLPSAPEFEAELLDGTPLEAATLWDDRPVVLVFTASWCESCADVHREAAEVVDQYGGAVGLLGVVGSDDAEDARTYARDLRLGHPIAVADEEVWLDYAAQEPPLVVVVAPGGTVLRGWPGGADSDVLAPTLDDMVAGSTEPATG